MLLTKYFTYIVSHRFLHVDMTGQRKQKCSLEINTDVWKPISSSVNCLTNYQVCLTHIRGLLGGGGCHKKLSLTGECLLHHVRL